jgi:hypothetical protein
MIFVDFDRKCKGIFGNYQGKPLDLKIENDVFVSYH